MSNHIVTLAVSAMAELLLGVSFLGRFVVCGARGRFDFNVDMFNSLWNKFLMSFVYARARQG